MAIKATVRFDVTEWLKERRRWKEKNLRLLCPHAVGEVYDDGELGVRSTYISPAGTTAYRCQMCGKVTYDESETVEGLRYWVEHPEYLLARYGKMRTLAKSLGRD